MVNKKSGNLVSAAIILGIASLLSRVVGLVRERVFTTTFGAGDTFDAFLAAFRVPDLIFNLIVIGALSAAFIPLFTDKLVNGGRKAKEEAHEFASAVLTSILLVVGVLSLLYAIIAPWIVPIITPGFTGDKLALTVMLSRIMALQPILLGLSFVFSGILNSYKKFLAYALAPVIYNIGIIFGVLFLVPWMGVAGLGVGVVIGAFLHMLVQLPSVLGLGYRVRFSFLSSRKDVVALWRMMIPRMFGLAAQQVNLIVVTVIGSNLVTGSITAFHLANNIQYVPVGIFGLAFAQAAFPTLAEQYSRKQKQAFITTLTKSFRYILFFVIPVSLYFYMLRSQIVRVLFGDGAFDWEDTFLTFETFGFLLVSVFAQATIPLLARAFYVQQDTKTPVIISFLSIVLNVVLALFLSPVYGVQGLAIAFSASAIVNLMMLLGVLHWQLGEFRDKEVLISLVRISFATIIGAIALQFLKYPIASVVNMQMFWGVASQMAGTFIGGVIVYLLVCWMLGSDELVALRKYLPKKAKLPSGMETPRFGGLLE